MKTLLVSLPGYIVDHTTSDNITPDKYYYNDSATILQGIL